MHALQDMMNRGFLIFGVDDSWTVRKIATPYDPRPFLPGSQETESKFTSQESAIEQVTAWIDEPQSTNYVVEAQFNDGLGPKFKVIGNLNAKTTMEADVAAERIGEQYFAKVKAKWSVRVRPAKISKF